MLTMKSIFVLSALASLAAASPCPYGQMAERGELSADQAKNFYDARSNGETAVEEQMETYMRSEKREEEVHAAQEQYYKRQLVGGLLPFGGGLLKGTLQAMTGNLSLIDIPA